MGSIRIDKNGRQHHWTDAWRILRLKKIPRRGAKRHVKSLKGQTFFDFMEREKK